MINEKKIQNIDNISNYDIETLWNDNINIKKNNSCPNCNSTNFIEDFSKGILFCNCGQIIDCEIYDNIVEKRKYDNDNEINNGLIHNKLLPQSSLGTIINARGRIRKIHIWNSMPYKERSDNIMFIKIHSVCINYKINKNIEDDAKIICKTTSNTLYTTGKNTGKPIITRGFNRAGIVAGCLFLACRRNNDSRSIKEISKYFNIKDRDVNKGIRSLQNILYNNKIIDNIGTSKILHFIKRKCDELKILRKNINLVLIIANNMDRLNIASNHTTYSLSAACILLMGNINKIKNINKKTLSKAFENLSEVTIIKAYDQIYPFRSVLIDNKKIDKILNDITLNNNNKINKQIWYKMKEFNIDTKKYIIDD